MQHQQYARARLSQPAYFILGCLSHGPRDAVALCEAIEQAEGLYIEPGTLYRVLAQLEQRGWIAGDNGGERLHRYHITALGMLALQQAEAKYQRNQEQQERNERSPGLPGGKEIIMRLVMWMLRLYPPAWRERYEGEMVALLWQHEITLWTVLDLLVGALDARLDPHYRQARQLVPMQRLQASWKWLSSAGVAFWLSLFLWAGMWDTRYPAPLASTIAIVSIFFGILPFLLVLIVWIVVQAILRKSGWNLLRLLPVALLILLFFMLPFQNGWLNDLFLGMFLASLALVAERGGAMLISVRRWQERQSPLLATLVRLLALVAISGMVAVCVDTGVWLVDQWDVLQQINLSSPSMPVQLLLGFVVMVLATVTALVALVRSTVALRAVSTAPNATFSLPQRDRTDPKAWIMILPVVLFVCLGPMMVFGHLTLMGTMGLLLFLVAGGIMMALAMKKYRPDTKLWIIVLSAVFFVFLLLLLYTGLILLHVGGPFSYAFLLTQTMLLLLLLFVFIDPAVKKYRVQVAAPPKQEPLQQVQRPHEQS